MDEHHRNIRILKEFIEDFEIGNGKGSYLFKALVRIKTVNNSDTEVVTGYMTLDGYNSNGEISFGGFDAELYPTHLKAKYDTFTRVGDTLEISGNHTVKPQIGKYTVTISEARRNTK